MRIQKVSLELAIWILSPRNLCEKSFSEMVRAETDNKDLKEKMFGDKLEVSNIDIAFKTLGNKEKKEG